MPITAPVTSQLRSGRDSSDSTRKGWNCGTSRLNAEAATPLLKLLRLDPRRERASAELAAVVEDRRADDVLAPFVLQRPPDDDAGSVEVHAAIDPRGVGTEQRTLRRRA